MLCVSPRTVDRHRANIALKLDLRGSHALTRFAVAHQSRDSRSLSGGVAVVLPQAVAAE